MNCKTIHMLGQQVHKKLRALYWTIFSYLSFAIVSNTSEYQTDIRHLFKKIVCNDLSIPIIKISGDPGFRSCASLFLNLDMVTQSPIMQRFLELELEELLFCVGTPGCILVPRYRLSWRHGSHHRPGECLLRKSVSVLHVVPAVSEVRGAIGE